jgi:sugar phosphate isomerase/epimerase
MVGSCRVAEVERETRALDGQANIKNPPHLLPPPPPGDPALVVEEALQRAGSDPAGALALLRDAAQTWMRQGEPRRAALALHRSAALRLRNEESPVSDLALAARLLEGIPDDRAIVLLDLGHALAMEGDSRRAILALRESERLARQTANHELLTAARHTLADLADDLGDYRSARAFLREAGQAMIYSVESDLLSTLRDMGNLPPNPRLEQERLRRQQAVEDELAALKRSMGV